MQTPKFLIDNQKKAKELLKKGAIGEVDFSNGTYRIEVLDAESFWPFLRVDIHGNVLDAFCSCIEFEDKNQCVHLAVSYLEIFRNEKIPLHIRFEKSFWREFFVLLSEKYGFNVDFKKVKRGYQFEDFVIHYHNKEGEKALKSLLENRIVETEENSIKFSNLSSQEIQAWKENRPSKNLQFELSVWADLAKQILVFQEKDADAKIEFKGKKIPDRIHVKINGYSFSTTISEEDWKRFILKLNTISSNLKVYPYGEDTLESISYHSESETLFLNKKKQTVEEFEEKIPLDGWEFSPGKGFYKKKEVELEETKIVGKKKIQEFLSEHLDLLQTYLKGDTIETEQQLVQYFLFFDDFSNLHIEAYLQEPGDLEDAQIFGEWAYHSSKGFFRISPLMFSSIEKIVSKYEVSEFVNIHRDWLHQFEKFQTHFQSLPSTLTYSLDENDQLCFDAYLYDAALEESSLDFGEWIYIKDRGFFSKYDLQMGLPISPNVKIAYSDIPGFISEHRDKLELIPGFFAKESPIEKIGLKVILQENEDILIEPKIQYKEGYDHKKVILLGTYSYVKNEGFFELPEIQKLEKNYQKPIVVPKDRIGSFLNYEWMKIESRIIELDPRLKRPESLRLKLKKIEKGKVDGRVCWLVDLYYESELGSVSIVVLKRACGEKQYVFSNAGLIDLQSSRYFWIHQIKRKPRIDSKLLRLSTLEWLRLSIYENIASPHENTKEAETTRKILQELESLHTDQLLDFSSYQSHLRPYQEAGLRWLWFLYCHDLSGLLCDDMGLGKTHQAMALMAASSKLSEEKYLVVCPTSVIYHWQDLLEKYLPNLRVLVYHGQSRTISNFKTSYDVLLTSYGILRTGRDPIHKITFDIAIFDEAQNAKNAASQTHQCLKMIHAKFRLGLTGTPIENTVRELKALMDLVLPNYLPDDKEFQTRFLIPIEKQKDETQQKLLKGLIRPFILRRKKKDVLLDLPEKIEQIRTCELSDEQKRLYREILEQSKTKMLQNLQDESRPIDYLHVFAMLSKLKQVCNHPSLILKDLPQYTTHESGKWDLFLELLSEARESQQKIVIFSQYLDMLQMIEMYLRQEKIGYAQIKGSTRDRKEQIQLFHQDPKCEVFIGSLLAAGVGIDLTCASVVIHYDRWWNPAKENQATDRVHRIGQNRGVQVFKLVTKHTVEERIHAMIENKQGLIENTLGTSDIEEVKLLSRAELMDILKRTSF